MAIGLLRLLAAGAVALLALTGLNGVAQGQPFSGTLEPLAGAETAASAAGAGFLYSVLDYYPEGPKLMVNGTFEGLSSPATVAHLHRAAAGPDAPGGPTPGPQVFDLIVSEAPRGTLNGSFWITEEQAEELRRGRYYVQVHSRDHPAGALRGWLVRGFLHNPEDAVR